MNKRQLFSPHSPPPPPSPHLLKNKQTVMLKTSRTFNASPSFPIDLVSKRICKSHGKSAAARLVMAGLQLQTHDSLQLQNRPSVLKQVCSFEAANILDWKLISLPQKSTKVPPVFAPAKVKLSLQSARLHLQTRTPVIIDRLIHTLTMQTVNFLTV